MARKEKAPAEAASAAEIDADVDPLFRLRVQRTLRTDSAKGVSGMVSMAHNNDGCEVALTLDGEHVVEVYGITRR